MVNRFVFPNSKLGHARKAPLGLELTRPALRSCVGPVRNEILNDVTGYGRRGGESVPTVWATKSWRWWKWRINGKTEEKQANSDIPRRELCRRGGAGEQSWLRELQHGRVGDGINYVVMNAEQSFRGCCLIWSR